MSGIIDIYGGAQRSTPRNVMGTALCPSMALRIMDEEKKRDELSLANCTFCGRRGEICLEGRQLLQISLCS